MAALAGRKVRIKIGGTAVAGAIADSITFNREHIDITDKDDEGVRVFLDEIGIFSYSATLSARLKDDTLLEWAADPTEVLKAITLEIEGIGTIASNAGMTTHNIGGNDGAEAATMEATFESSGPVTYTAAA
jgi:predicted secreted protein